MKMTTARRLTQAGFLLLTLVGVFIVGGNAERWCPFGGVEALYTYLTEGNLLCSLGISNFYILASVIVLTLVFRRAFCGYMCPIGTISEWTRRAASAFSIQPWSAPRIVNHLLSSVKYIVLVIILYITWRGGELHFRGVDPCYAMIGRHGEDITFWAYVIAAAILLGSLWIRLPFCQWLCPLGAVLNVFSKPALMRVHRDNESCSGCKRCDRACPMEIPVHSQSEVNQARCLSCHSCVDACPRQSQGALHWGLPRALGARRASGHVIVAAILVCVSAAIAGEYLFPMPSFVYSHRDAATSTRQLDLKIDGLTCRGRANLLVYFLTRDDDCAIPGFAKLEAWPGPDAAPARIYFDPQQSNAESITKAIITPYYDLEASLWRMSPFAIPEWGVADR